MTRAVIDTNVFVSSFFGGKPKAMIDLWKLGQINLCISQAIIEEHINVSARLGVQNEREIEALLEVFANDYRCVFTKSKANLFRLIEQVQVSCRSIVDWHINPHIAPVRLLSLVTPTSAIPGLVTIHNFQYLSRRAPWR